MLMNSSQNDPKHLFLIENGELKIENEKGTAMVSY